MVDISVMLFPLGCCKSTTRSASFSVVEQNGLVPLDLHQCLYPLVVTGAELPGTDGLVPLGVTIEVRGPLAGYHPAASE